MKKFIHSFSEDCHDMRELLCNKAITFAEMSNLNLPVPPGFTLTSEFYSLFTSNNNQLSEELKNHVIKAVKELENITGKKLGSLNVPLLLSIRSETTNAILNLGLNDEILKSCIDNTRSELFPLNCYRKLIQTYTETIAGVKRGELENIVDDIKGIRGLNQDSEINEGELRELIEQLKTIYKDKTKEQSILI